MERQEAGDLRVLILADDPLAHAGLSGLVAAEPGFAIADDISELGASTMGAGAFTPDVVLWALESGGEAGSASHEVSAPSDLERGDLPIVALVRDDSLLERAWAAGARGLLLRDAEPETIVRALAAVHSGLVVVDAGLADATIALRDSAPGGEELTPRELEVLELLAEGLSNKRIARRLEISENTVKFHVSALLRKFGASSRTEAVMRAARQGLVII